MNQHTKKIIEELCDYLGYDLESPMCKELHEHAKKHPEVQAYIDSIKMTVKICKAANKDVSVPENIKKELLEKLKSKKIDS